MKQLKRVRHAVPLPGYRLALTLSDGSVVERDVSRLLAGPLFGALKDEALFGAVRVEGGSVAWPTGADICPDVLIWGGAPPEQDIPAPRVLRLEPEPESASAE